MAPLPWKKSDDTIKTPSRFGSHASMVVGDVCGISTWLLLRDERGVYATDRSRLDTGTVDQHRAASTEFREARINQRLVEEGWTSLEEFVAYYSDWGNSEQEADDE